MRAQRNWGSELRPLDEDRISPRTKFLLALTEFPTASNVTATSVSPRPHSPLSPVTLARSPHGQTRMIGTRPPPPQENRSLESCGLFAIPRIERPGIHTGTVSASSRRFSLSRFRGSSLNPIKRHASGSSFCILRHSPYV